jgi:hypothetical protein
MQTHDPRGIDYRRRRFVVREQAWVDDWVQTRYLSPGGIAE